MSSITDARRKEVLRAIVAGFISSQEPVGSKALLERYQLGVSSATIRNDMAVLESEGLITQPHASSGRVPTEKGYRVFVDSLHDLKPLSRPERKAMLTFLDGGVDLQDVLHRAARMLAQITDSAAVVQMPNLRVSMVKHCEVVALSPVRLLVVVITDNGRVEQRNVELDSVMEAEDVLRLRDVLNNALAGKTLAEATAHLDILEEQVALDIRPHLRKAANVLVDTLVEYPAERYLLAGTPNLTRSSITSRGIDLSGILEALEEQVVVLNLLTRVPEVGNISVVIGEEHDDDQLRQASVVTTAYGTDGEVLGGLGVVGPTFMDYSGTMSRVSAVAHYVSDILGHE